MPETSYFAEFYMHHPETCSLRGADWRAPAAKGAVVRPPDPGGQRGGPVAARMPPGRVHLADGDGQRPARPGRGDCQDGPLPDDRPPPGADEPESSGQVRGGDGLAEVAGAQRRGGYRPVHRAAVPADVPLVVPVQLE